VRIAFFFCQFDQATSLNADTILRSIIRQSLGDANLPRDFETCLEKIAQNPFSGTKELQNLLQKVISSSRLSYIIIDALDECEKHERNLVFDILQSINVSNGPKAKLFLASRESVAEEVKYRFTSLLHVSMNAAEAQSDIAIYIRETLEERVRSRELVVGNNTLLQEIQDALTQGAQGMLVASISEIRFTNLTMLGSFGWLSRLRTSAPSVMMTISVEHFGWISLRRLTAHCSESFPTKKQRLPSKCSDG